VAACLGTEIYGDHVLVLSMRTSFVLGKPNMSADEDTELRDLVAQTLETNGVLGRIRVTHYFFTFFKVQT